MTAYLSILKIPGKKSYLSPAGSQALRDKEEAFGRMSRMAVDFTDFETAVVFNNAEIGGKYVNLAIRYGVKLIQVLCHRVDGKIVEVELEPAHKSIARGYQIL